MNNVIINKIAAPALMLAAMLASFSCTPPPKGIVEVTAVATPDGAIIVETTTITATVKAIDAARRKVTLVYSNGSKTTYKAGPEVVNFDRIQAGDLVTAAVTEEVAVFLGSGAPPSGTVATGVALAPVGAKPGAVIVDTEQMTVKVTAVDAAKNRVTFELPDGTTKKVRIGKNVDLSTVQPGDNVTVRVTEGFAITVEKP